MVTYIYGLIDPDTHECRYVGKADNIQKRLSQHVSAARVEITHKGRWLCSLLTKGLQPEILIFECVPTDIWQDSEVWWISYMRCLGARLTNATVGGDGMCGVPEICLKISNSLKGHVVSEETRKKLSDSTKGRKVSQEVVSRLVTCNKGKSLSPEHRAKIAAPQKGIPKSEEIRAKMAKAKRGSHHVSPSKETREKIAAKQRGIKRGPLSETAKEKLRIAQQLRRRREKGE